MSIHWISEKQKVNQRFLEHKNWRIPLSVPAKHQSGAVQDHSKACNMSMESERSDGTGPLMPHFTGPHLTRYESIKIFMSSSTQSNISSASHYRVLIGDGMNIIGLFGHYSSVNRELFEHEHPNKLIDPHLRLDQTCSSSSASHYRELIRCDMNII